MKTQHRVLKCCIRMKTLVPSGIGKPVTRGVKDVNENTASSPQVLHQNENTRTFRHWETCCENVRPTQWNKVDPSPSPEGDETRRQGQWDDLVNLHVSNNEGSGPDYEDNLRTTKKTEFEQVKTWLDSRRV